MIRQMIKQLIVMVFRVFIFRNDFKQKLFVTMSQAGTTKINIRVPVFTMQQKVGEIRLFLGPASAFKVHAMIPK
jgi:hypothetical protein